MDIDQEPAALSVRIVGEIEESSDSDNPIAQEELPLNEEKLDPALIQDMETAPLTAPADPPCRRP